MVTAQADTSNQHSIEGFLDKLEQRFDIHFIHESDIFEGSTFKYDESLFEKPISEIIEVFQKNTSFQAINMSPKDTETLVFAIKRVDSKATIKGRIVDQNNEGLTHSTINVPGLGVGVISDFRGFYELDIDAGNHLIVANYVGHEEEQITIDIAPGKEIQHNFILEPTSFPDEIVITGSRSVSAGTLTAGSTIIEHGTIAKLINLKGAEIDAYVELSELLHVQQPSFHSVHQHISDGTDHLDPATLRGMGPDQTLVLINGKRRHQSAFLNISNTVGKGSVFTDLNSIPLAIIERIEILQDGAASQYGSDAIAGVINVILKEDTYSEVNLKSGVSNEGDGFIYDLSSNFGFKLNDDGAFINVSLNRSQRDATNRSLEYEGTIFDDPVRDSNPQFRRDFFDSTGSGVNNPEDSTEFATRFGQSELVTTTIFGNAEIPLNESTNIYGFGGYSFKRGGSIGLHRFPFQILEDLPFGFSPQLDSEITDRAVTLGLTKRFTNGVLDISNTFGRNGVVYKILDPINITRIGPGVIPDQVSGEVQYGQNTSNIDYSHLLNTNIPVTVNAGAEFRIENYTQIAGNSNVIATIDRSVGITNESLQLFPRFDETHELNEFRTNLGIYLDMETDLTEQLRLGLSGRFERYDDFGNNFSWKIFSRWNPSKNVSFKFSYNTGFRAPSLHQFFFESRLNQFIPTADGFRAAVVDQYSHVESSDSPLSQLNVDPLEAESSSSFNLGLVFRPTKNWSVSTNFYQIDVDDRIILTGRLSSELDSPVIRDVLSQTNSTDVQFFTNAIGTTTVGFEFITKYYIPFKKKGSLDFTFSGHINNVTVEEEDGTILPNLNTTLQGFEDEIFNRFEIGLLESAQPNSKLIFATSAHTGKFSFHTRFTRYGSISFLHPLDGDESNFVVNEITGTVESRDQEFSSKIITDFSTQVSITDNLSFSLGVNNLFNVFPDENEHSANRADEVYPFNRFVQQFGTRGSFGYANLNVKF